LLSTVTRARTTDAVSRKRPGIVLIRIIALRRVRWIAERRYRERSA
jgi:hypothetical protein